MSDIVIRCTVDSETLHLPELQSFIGKTVEIVIRERPEMPADVPERWRALWEIGGEDLIDSEAVRRLRYASLMQPESGAGEESRRLVPDPA